MKVDKTVINSINKRNILELIRVNGPISRTELAQVANLSLPTIMKIVDEMIALGVVLDSGKGVSTGGKPPKMVEFNFGARYIFGVDINDYKIDVILMDMAANIICERVRDVDRYMDSRKMVSCLKTMIYGILSDSATAFKKILGIGIGFHGVIDQKTGRIVYSPAMNWRDEDILTPLRQEFCCPIILDNETRAMAMGEKLVGQAKSVENFVCVNIGYDIDAAIVLNGNLHYGVSSQAGTLGNAPVGICSAQRLNDCATPRVLQEIVQKRIKEHKRGEGSLILDMVFGHADRITIYTIIEAAENGDALAIALLKQSAQYIGNALLNMISLLDPELIIINGKLPRLSRVFMEELNSCVYGWNREEREQVLRMEFSNLGKHLACIGAASFILSRFIDNGGIATFMEKI